MTDLLTYRLTYEPSAASHERVQFSQRRKEMVCGIRGSGQSSDRAMGQPAAANAASVSALGGVLADLLKLA